MKRRSFTLGGLVATGLAVLGLGRRASAEGVPDYELRARADAAAARKYFPYELIEVNGDQALIKWKELKGAGRGTPVVIGGEASGLRNLFESFAPPSPNFPSPPSAQETLAKAAQIRWPDDFIAQRKADAAEADATFRKQLAENPNMPLPAVVMRDADGHSHTLSREETLAELEMSHEPETGDWPAQPDGSPGLTVASDILKGTPLPKVYIALIPTDDWTAIPAYLHWGGWNECPVPEYHVAALRSWRDRYGVELVGLAFDTLNLTATRPPHTREDALALAKEQYVYCADIIDQGVETYSALAATLMANDWWFFWWD